MAHEITATDGVVLHKRAAWHGMGTIVQDAPTPTEALNIAGLGWRVKQWPLLALPKDEEGYAEPFSHLIEVPDTVANIRDDTREVLGIVSRGYTPVQNVELAEFCELLAEQGDEVRVESAGSIRGGKKVWFLLKGESFSVRNPRGREDEVAPYICVSNGHYGGMAFRCTPTTIRVVCSNTLDMVIPQRDSEGGILKLKPNAFVACHVGDVRRRVEEAKAALGLYGKSLTEMKELVEYLSTRGINDRQVEEFFVRAYSKMRGPIPLEPETEAQLRAKERAEKFVSLCLSRMVAEETAFGCNGWTMLNAFTGALQASAKTADTRAARCLVGTYGAYCQDAFELALQTVA